MHIILLRHEIDQDGTTDIYMDDVYRPVVATRSVHGHSSCGDTVFKRRHISKGAWSWTGGCLSRTTIHNIRRAFPCRSEYKSRQRSIEMTDD